MRSSPLVVLLVAVGCSASNDVGKAAVTSVTSGETNPSKPPTSRTIDKTGYQDNAGHSTEEIVSRGGEMSGVRGTEAGDDRPTGTNTGIPNGARETVAGAEKSPLIPRSASVQPHMDNTSPLTAYADEPGKLARAVCDHEHVCNRVGPDHPFGSDDACLSAVRARTLRDFEAASCNANTAALALCVADLRRAECSRVIGRPSDLEDCAAHAICAP